MYKKILFLIFVFTTTIGYPQDKKINVEKSRTDWPNYGRDGGGMRFSPVTDIHTDNVKQLKPAWTFQTGELETYTGTRAQEDAAFEATPIMIEGTLYFSTPSCRVFAIDAGNGKQKWLFDPKVNLKQHYSEITSRGVSSWPSGTKLTNNNRRRIFAGTIDGRLIALDAASGKIISSFGNNGTIDLKEGVGKVSLTSPPAVIGNLLIVGSSMGDNERMDYPRGVVRAFDVITGKLIWKWDPITSDPKDKASTTWNGTNAKQTGAANAWSVISVDPENNLVFIPTSSPSPDYYGGERLGKNLYGNSLVAVNAITGKMIWYFQVVHHDLWDYDIAAQPVLFEVKRNNKMIAAVAVGTKMGHIFILDRKTGKPIFPVEERTVPASSIPGEMAHPTQPFPVLPAPLGLQSITAKDAWGLTPKDKEEAEKRILKFTNKGVFTPPSFEGTLVTPGNAGGIHWGGMTYDPVRNLLITNINRFPAIIRILQRESLDQFNKENHDFLRAETGMMRGTPYIMKRDYLITVDSATGQFSLQYQPPWGTLLAIDLNNGEKKWEVPLGYMMDVNKYPEARNWGSINLGGAITTAGKLIFVAATMDNHFRAFHSETGKLLWEYQLPASAQATPMTYHWIGKQYVVIAAGGHGKLDTKQGDFVIAFALD